MNTNYSVLNELIVDGVLLDQPVIYEKDLRLDLDKSIEETTCPFFCMKGHVYVLL